MGGARWRGTPTLQCFCGALEADRQAHYLACPVWSDWASGCLHLHAQGDESDAHRLYWRVVGQDGTAPLKAAVALDCALFAFDVRRIGSQQAPRRLLDTRLKELRRRWAVLTPRSKPALVLAPPQQQHVCVDPVQDHSHAAPQEEQGHDVGELREYCQGRVDYFESLMRERINEFRQDRTDIHSRVDELQGVLGAESNASKVVKRPSCAARMGGGLCSTDAGDSQIAKP